METKYITIPFDIERAKRISNHEEVGKIVTRDGRDVRIVCWDRNYENYPIVALVKFAADETEDVIYLTHNGYYYLKGTNNDDLLLSVPEWTTYKDGDILYAESIFGSDFIFVKKNGSHKTFKYVSLMNKIDLSFENRHCCEDSNIKNIRKATKEEEQTIINALRLSKNELAKEYLKRFFNFKEEHKFEPFDKVLVRDDSHDTWSADFYSRMSGRRYKCVGNIWNYCLPYNEQTKRLVGTSDNWEE